MKVDLKIFFSRDDIKALIHNKLKDIDCPCAGRFDVLPAVGAIDTAKGEYIAVFTPIDEVEVFLDALIEEEKNDSTRIDGSDVPF